MKSAGAECIFCVSRPSVRSGGQLSTDTWTPDCETFILRRKQCVVLSNGSYDAPFFSKNITEAHPSTWSIDSSWGAQHSPLQGTPFLSG